MARFGAAVPWRRGRRTEPVADGQLHWLQLDLDYGLHCGTPECTDRVVVLRYAGRWHPLCEPCLLKIPSLA